MANKGITMSLEWKQKNPQAFSDFKKNIDALKQGLQGLNNIIKNMSSSSIKVDTTSAIRNVNNLQSLLSRFNRRVIDIKVRLNSDSGPKKAISEIKRATEIAKRRISNDLNITPKLQTNDFINDLNRLVHVAQRAGNDIRRSLNVHSAGPKPTTSDRRHEHGNPSSTSKDSDTLGGLVGAAGAIEAGKQVIKTFASARDEVTGMRNQMKFMYGDELKASEAISGMFDVAKETHQSLGDVKELFASMQINAKETHRSIQQDLQTTKTVMIASKVGGGTSAGNSNAIIQLQQAIQRGKMMTDDWRSIAAQAPGIEKMMMDGLGKSKADIQKMITAGKLTSEEILKAIDSQAESYAKMNAQASLTYDNVKHYAHTVLLSIINDITGVSDSLNAIYEKMIAGIDFVSAAWKKAFGLLTTAMDGAEEASVALQDAILSLGSGAVIAGVGALISMFWGILIPMAAISAAMFGIIRMFRTLKEWSSGRGILQSWFGDIEPYKKKFEDFMDGVKSAISSLATYLTPLITSVSSILIDSLDIIKSLANGVVEAFTFLGDILGDILGVGGDTPLEKALNSFGTLGNWLVEVFTNLMDFTSNLFSFIGDVLANDTDEINRKITRVFAVMGQYISMTFENMIAKIMLAMADLMDKFGLDGTSVRTSAKTTLETNDRVSATERAIAANPDIMNSKERAENLNSHSDARNKIDKILGLEDSIERNQSIIEHVGRTLDEHGAEKGGAMLDKEGLTPALIEALRDDIKESSEQRNALNAELRKMGYSDNAIYNAVGIRSNDKPVEDSLKNMSKMVETVNNVFKGVGEGKLQENLDFMKNVVKNVSEFKGMRTEHGEQMIHSITMNPQFRNDIQVWVDGEKKESFAQQGNSWLERHGIDTSGYLPMPKHTLWQMIGLQEIPHEASPSSGK